MKNKRKKGG